MPGWQADVIGSGIAPLAAANINGQGLGAQTALGNSQGTAFAINVCTVEFTTVAASTGAILPGTGGRIGSGDIIAVYNQGANALSVYPPVGFKIGLGSVNAAVSVASGKAALFAARGDGNYFSFLSA